MASTNNNFTNNWIFKSAPSSSIDSSENAVTVQKTVQPVVYQYQKTYQPAVYQVRKTVQPAVAQTYVPANVSFFFKH